MSVMGSFAVGFSYFVRVHIAPRRWPATTLVNTWDFVGCTVSGNQLMDPTGMLIWGGREGGREASCCDTVVSPGLPSLATTWFTEISQSLLWCRSITTALHCLPTGLRAFRMLHLSFYFGLEMLMEKIIKLCVIYFWLKISIVTVQFVRSFLC